MSAFECFVVGLLFLHLWHLMDAASPVLPIQFVYITVFWICGVGFIVAGFVGLALKA